MGNVYCSACGVKVPQKVPECAVWTANKSQENTTTLSIYCCMNLYLKCCSHKKPPEIRHLVIKPTKTTNGGRDCYVCVFSLLKLVQDKQMLFGVLTWGLPSLAAFSCSVGSLVSDVINSGAVVFAAGEVWGQPMGISTAVSPLFLVGL